MSTSFHGFSQPSFSALSFECSLSSSFYSTWAFFTSPCNFLCTSPVEAFATSSCMPCSFVVQANLLWGNYSSNSIYLENMNSKVVITPRPHFLIPYSSREEPAMFLCNVLCCILKSFFEPVLPEARTVLCKGVTLVLETDKSGFKFWLHNSSDYGEIT